MTRIDIELEAKHAQERTQLLIETASGTKRLMAGIAAELLAQTERNFSSQRQHGGASWPALAPATQKLRKRKGHGATSPMLKGRNPHLVRAFNTQSTNQQASIASSVAYAAIHQLGGKAGRGLETAIPARPFLPVKADRKTLTEPMQNAIRQILITHFKNANRS